MKSLVKCFVALIPCLLCAATAAHAQAYPAKPIRLLVGFPAGGGADGMARLTATHLAEALGGQIVVENRPGAGGTLAADALAKAPADGYTLYFADTSVLVAPAIYASVPYDPQKSFAPVGMVGILPLVIVANPALPANNPAELIALLRANPGKYSYASPGIGTVTSPGKLSGASEWPALADTLPGFDASPSVFVIAPVGTPAAVISRLDAALKGVLTKPVVLDALAAQGAKVTPGSAEQLAAFIASEVRKWGAVARESGAKAQ